MLEGIISEGVTITAIDGPTLDRSLALGFRSHGNQLFRYNHFLFQDELHHILALRVEIAAKSQRRVLCRNEDLAFEWVKPVLDVEHESLMLRHARRFTHNVPTSICDFLGEEPGDTPFPCLALEVREDGRLLACSYIAVGETATSGIYAYFDPEEAGRALGILTMLKEIEFTKARGMQWYYPGYVTLHPGVYDYKKQLHALSYFNWEDEWLPFPRGGWPESVIGTVPNYDPLARILGF